MLGTRGAIQAALHWPIGVVEWCEVDPMARGGCRNLLDTLRSDAPSSLGERLEPALESQRHAFEQASVGHIGERMAIYNSAEIGGEPHSARDLSEPSKEDRGTGQLGAWRKVLRVARIANDGVGGDPAQQKRR